jgi:membrane fusion protein, multidrug efflux system
MKFHFCLTAGLCLIGCGNQTPATSVQASAASNQKIEVVTVESRQLDTTLTLPAQISPYEAVDIFSKVTGFIETISVDRGSRVHAGELIVRVSAPELLAQRSQAEASLQGAQAQLAAAQARFASDQGTYSHLQAASETPGVVAKNDLLVAEQTAAADGAQVDAASKNVQAAKDSLAGVTQLESYLDIRAPFDGVVTARYLHPGALVGPAAGQPGAQPIVRIESTNRLRIVVPVPETYVGGIREGAVVGFTVPAYPGRSFQAPVARIAHDINQTTRTMQVELDFRNDESQLTPGSFAQVDWPIRRSYPTLFVPTSAVTTDLQRTFVIRVQQGKAEWVDVKIGVTANNQVEIFGQLRAGDGVVRNATDSIRNGTAVLTDSK